VRKTIIELEFTLQPALDNKDTKEPTRHNIILLDALVFTVDKKVRRELPKRQQFKLHSTSLHLFNFVIVILKSTFEVKFINKIELIQLHAIKDN
jgi:hypothetical protein